MALRRAILTAYASLLAQVPEIVNIPNFSLFGMDLTAVPSKTFPSVTMIIPIVCFALQFVTMKLTRKFTYQSPATEAAQNNMSMKIMDFAMPLMSLYFCFILQGAIGLYWIYQNVFSFAQTVILAKTMPVPRFTEEDIKQAEKEMKAKGYNTKKPICPAYARCIISTTRITKRCLNLKTKSRKARLSRF